MKGEILLAVLSIILLIFIGLMWYDSNYYTSETEIIVPTSMTPASDKSSAKVMDECNNIYRIYNEYSFVSYGEPGTDLKLLYCKENKVPCKITITHHLFGNEGISSAKIVNASRPTSCEL